MRLSNGFVIDKEKTFGELKFTAVRDCSTHSSANLDEKNNGKATKTLCA